MEPLQLLEFLFIIPLSFGLIITQLPQLFSSLQKQQQNLSLQPAGSHNLSRNMISAIKLWSSVLFIFFFILTCCESRMTPLISFIIISLILSSSFIEYETAQLVFHVVASCSWIGCFDLYFRSSFDEDEFFHFFDMKWFVAVFLTTSIVMRAHLAQKWQLHSIPHMFVGIPVLCLYYWGLEMPICCLTETSFFSCELMRSPPAILRDTELSDYYRVFGVLSIILVHVIYGLVMRSFLPDEEDMDSSASSSSGSEDARTAVSSDSCRKRRTISGVESQREVANSSNDQSVSTVTLPTTSVAVASEQLSEDASHRHTSPQVDELPVEKKTAAAATAVAGLAPSSPYSSCDLSNYTSDLLLRLPSILEDSISASFWSSLASFQPNLLHPHLQHNPSPSSSHSSSTSSHPALKVDRTKDSGHHKRCGSQHHVPSQSQRILRNPISHSPPPLPLSAPPRDDEDPDEVSSSSSRHRSTCARPVLDFHSYVPVPLPAPHDQAPRFAPSTHSYPLSNISPGSTGVGNISEEEAFEIVQKRLHSCKTKRAH
jgi:hypothetical protein